MSALDRIVVFIATGAWLGFAPMMPGTIGAVWGLPLAMAINMLSWPVRVAAILGVNVLGIFLCKAAAQRLAPGKTDPQPIVLDEIASMPLVFLLVPPESQEAIAVGFVLHRVFDISKAPPAAAVEHLPGGLGIMADDWVAGIYAGLVLYLLHAALNWP